MFSKQFLSAVLALLLLEVRKLDILVPALEPLAVLMEEVEVAHIVFALLGVVEVAAHIVLVVQVLQPVASALSVCALALA